MVWASSSWKLGYVNALTEKAWEDAQSCTHLYKRVEQIYCGLIITEVSNNGGDGLLRETSLKKSRCFKLYRAYSISSNSPNASNFFFLTLNSNGLCQNSGKEKGSRCLGFTSLTCIHILKKTWNWVYSDRSRAMTAKKCTNKKAWCTCRVVVLLILTNCFFAFLADVAVLLSYGQATEVYCWMGLNTMMARSESAIDTVTS